MPSFFDNGPMPDWRELRNMFGKEFPWAQVEKLTRNRDGSWLNDVVRGLFDREGREDRADGEARPAGAGRKLRASVSKQAKHVTVSIAVPPEAMAGVRLFATASRLKIAGADDGRMQVVQFPCPVYPRSGRAYARNGRLKVKFRRQPPDRREVELFIRS